MLGDHMIKLWSTTQAVIAISSGEAEYYGMVKGGSIGLGTRELARDLGLQVRIRLHSDASAAIGIVNRKGLGRVRHIEVNQLWLQDKVASKDIELAKVASKANLADALTKYVGSEDLRYHCKGTGQYILEGRHPLMPETDIINRGNNEQ